MSDVIQCYVEIRRDHQLHHDRLLRRQRRTAMILGLVVFSILSVIAGFIRVGSPVYSLLAGFSAIAVIIVLLLRLQSPIARALRLIDLYDIAIARVDGTQPHSPLTGEQAAEAFAPKHLYLRDLDIVGPNSLFSLLATVRTGIGERGLARYLLVPATHDEVIARQQAVRELLPQTQLRERLYLVGQSKFQQLSASFFDEWLADPPPTFSPIFRIALLTTALINAGLVLAGLTHLRDWAFVWPNLAAVLAVQSAIALLIRDRVRPLLEGGARLQGQIKLFAEGLDLLETTALTSPKLLALQRAASHPAGAVKALRRLDGILTVIEQRTKELFFVLSLIFAIGSHSAISLANWKRHHTPAMRLWLDAWAEFEALNAISTYAFEHPADGQAFCWPELLPQSASPLFTARSLGHALLPVGIRNDIHLGAPPAAQFFLISGSNMAGKSTLLRSIGTASVLAYAGAPVPAASLRLTLLAVAASISLTDSLADGKSKFLAEVERLASIVRLSSNAPVLFLVDEIFSGTNSADRQTAAAAVLRQLLGHAAIGALSTHDLALTALATEENRGLNLHMASPDPADPLAFDYLLKPGINQYSSALAIIRLLGLDA
jgi:hypothetical protein